MRHFKPLIMAFVGLIFLYFSNCASDKSFEFEKEKIQYKNQIDSMLSKIERKLVELKSKYNPTESVEERAIEELTEPEIAVDSTQQVIIQLEHIEEHLNKKLGELEYVQEEQWPQLKSEIDLLFDEYNKLFSKMK